MKILSVIRQVPDAESSLRAANDSIDLSNTRLVMDTMDEYGVEEALRLREAGSGIEVIALAVGRASSEEILRGALAMGADRAIHVKTDLVLDPVALSGVVAKIVVAEGVELVLCGGRQTDWDSEALGAAVAERLGWPQLTWTNELALKEGALTGRHDVDEGSEGFTVALPAEPDEGEEERAADGDAGGLWRGADGAGGEDGDSEPQEATGDYGGGR